jgi:hypothetical protein
MPGLRGAQKRMLAGLLVLAGTDGKLLQRASVDAPA